MSVKSGQILVVPFCTSDPDTGAGQNADSLPTVTLRIDGVANAATVTVTNTGTGGYDASVTLPTFSGGESVSLVANATVNTIASPPVPIFTDIADTKRVGDLNDFDGTGATLTAAYDHAKDNVLTPLAVVQDAIAALPGAQVGTRIDETSVDSNGDVLGLATPGSTITAYLASDTDRSDPVRQTTAATDGSWALYLPDGTYTLVVVLDGHYDAAEGDSEITRTVVVA